MLSKTFTLFLNSILWQLSVTYLKQQTCSHLELSSQSVKNHLILYIILLKYSLLLSKI